MVVSNCRFVDSPISSLAIHPAIDWDSYPRNPTRGIRIENNTFQRSQRAPIYIALGGQWAPEFVA